MGLIYRNQRVGKNRQIFMMYKFRTLKNGTDITNSFARNEYYTKLGRFLRKTKLDELPQLLNWLKGDVNLFGYRAEEERSFNLLPKDIQDILLSHKPGIIDLASLHFFDEEKILQLNGDLHRTYYEKIRPMKLTLQMFYLENRCWLLNLAIIWIYLKKMTFSLLHR